MSRITPFVVAAATFISISAFGQTATTDASNTPATTTMPSSSSTATASSAPKMHHRHHDKDMATHTDHDADKLNACVANAVPTAKDESCLKNAEGAS